MVFPLHIALNASAEMADAANWPHFRLFQVATSPQPHEARNVSGAWRPATPASVGPFSAVCYMTARNVERFRQAQDPSHRVPIGLIQSAVGGTRVEAWMSAEALTACPHPPLVGSNANNQPSVLWNGMVAPLTSVLPRTFLWYQGVF